MTRAGLQCIEIGLQDGDPIGLLLFDYLVHEGLWGTASRVAQDILLGTVQVSEQVCHVSHFMCHSQ